MKLIELTDDFLAVLGLLSVEPDEEDCTLLTKLDEIEKDLTNKIDGYAHIVNVLNGNAEMARLEATRVNVRAARFQQKADWLKERLKAAMTKIGTRKIDTPYHTVTICKNGGAVPLLIERPVEDLPEELREQVIVWNARRERIRELLEKGKEIAGCRLGDRGEHVRIK